MSDLILFDKGLAKKDTQKIETDIFNYRSKELFINLKESDIPPKGHPDRDAFIDYEETKCLQGVNINGTMVPPTFYWDICHWSILKDIMDNRGIIRKVPSRPDIRDNDWIIHNALYRAESITPKENLIEGTARQLGKTKNKSSILGRDMMLIDNCNDLLLCGNANDLGIVLGYLFFGTENCTEFFRVPRLTKDKKAKLFEWGFKTKEGDNIIKSALHVRNAQDGNVTEVSAGVTIYRAILDEVGKYLFRSSYETVRPATVSSFGIRSSSILSFTGGDVERSKDAEELFTNPKTSGFCEFENEGKKTGLFLSGLYRQDFKYEKKLGEWLELEDKNSELYDLPIKISDFDLANKILDQEELAASKSSEPSALIKQKMYNPRQISHMFLTPNKNPFDIDGLQRHEEFLKANPQGVYVDLYRDEKGEVAWKNSNKKPILEYPTPKNIDLDAPIIVYDFPKHTEHYALHVSGFDPVNNLGQNSNSDSLPSIIVMRRNHTDLKDPYRNCIVAEYTARPKSFNKIFLRNVELLQEFYNMQILHEDSGNAVTLYFDERKKSNVLMDTPNLQKAMNVNSKANNVKGLKANGPNNQVREEVLVNYSEEELEDGKAGYTRIPSIALVQEMISYDGMGEDSRNTDRVDAFSYALLQVTTLEKYNKTRPFVTHIEKEEKPQKKLVRDAFGRTNAVKFNRNVFGY